MKSKRPLFELLQSADALPCIAQAPKETHKRWRSARKGPPVVVAIVVADSSSVPRQRGLADILESSSTPRRHSCTAPHAFR